MPQQVAMNATNVGIKDLLQTQLNFFEDISGVAGVLQGKRDNNSNNASLFAYQTNNATLSLLDILETFLMRENTPGTRGRFETAE